MMFANRFYSADRCLLFPIGCVPGVNCTDRLEIRRVESGEGIKSSFLVFLTSVLLVFKPWLHSTVGIPKQTLIRTWSVMRDGDLTFSGSNTGNIIISLNLHVSRTAHMLVAVPMPDLSVSKGNYGSIVQLLIESCVWIAILCGFSSLNECAVIQ